MADRLTERQAQVLGTVKENSPATVADVAGHLLEDESSVRGILDRLEKRALVARTYTGHHDARARHAFHVTRKGAELVDAYYNEEA